MRFKQFLDEAKHRQDISMEKAVELLKANCSDYFKSAGTMIYRGSRNMSEEAYLVQGDSGGRGSANTTNYYTVIMDHVLASEGYPKRAASIICANAENKYVAKGYGKLYVIVPFDGVKIGVTSDRDIWYTKITLGKSRTARRIDHWNDELEECAVPDYSFETIVDYIEDVLLDPEDEHFNLLSDWFSSGKVADQLKESYSAESMQLDVATTAEYQKYERGERELWIGGKCVAIREDAWEDIMKEMT